MHGECWFGFIVKAVKHRLFIEINIFLLFGGCSDAISNCNIDPAICLSIKLQEFVKTNCKRTCGYCDETTTTSPVILALDGYRTIFATARSTLLLRKCSIVVNYANYVNYRQTEIKIDTVAK
ncbi:shTK domain protein [Dictyocaulus viviparus]|uniref:ShTK domain protein n=1 Tax=Dictyocaulus viviparus TaxID=29172 RepID=A0A0D8XEK7_DICVI|nr:shTK domain protein [Dictyocaulus viviparus]